MRNKPHYSLFYNAKYALEGFKACFTHETACKIELFFFLLLSFLLWFFPLSLLCKTILQTSLFIPLIAELFNSAIESVVDLVSKEFHPLAKMAKDMAAAGVLFSLFLTLGIWIGVAIYAFF